VEVTHYLLPLQITRAGHLALLSTCWYLDHDGDWKEYYRCDPHKFTFNKHQQNLVIGGESCIWTEYADAGTVVQRIFPRASVVAEKLWSLREHTNDLKQAERRLEEFRCKLIRRGVSARPVGGASFCPGEYGADWPGLAGAHIDESINQEREKEFYLRVDYAEMTNAIV
jgi:hexosaminidase